MAVTAHSEIRRIIRAKDAGITNGRQAVLDILKNLQEQLGEELGRAALGSWDAYHLRQVLSSVSEQILTHQSQTKTALTGLLKDSWGLGQALVDAPLATGGIYTGFHLSTSVLEALTDFTMHKIEGLYSGTLERVKGEITLGILGQKTPQQVAQVIGQSLKTQSIFKSVATRAEVITKTEMGRAFSQATQLRMDQAAKAVPQMEKQWFHVGHPTTPRASHVAAHGRHVPVSRPFMIGETPMMFPRDPGAPLEEVINCGCDHRPYMAKWEKQLSS